MWQASYDADHLTAEPLVVCATSLAWRSQPKKSGRDVFSREAFPVPVCHATPLLLNFWESYTAMAPGVRPGQLLEIDVAEKMPVAEVQNLRVKRPFAETICSPGFKGPDLIPAGHMAVEGVEGPMHILSVLLAEPTPAKP